MKKFNIVMAALAVVCFIGTAAFPQTYPEGIISYWKFDDCTVTDTVFYLPG